MSGTKWFQTETRSIGTGTPPPLLATIWNESSLQNGRFSPSLQLGGAGRSSSGLVYRSLAPSSLPSGRRYLRHVAENPASTGARNDSLLPIESRTSSLTSHESDRRVISRLNEPWRTTKRSRRRHRAVPETAVANNLACPGDRTGPVGWRSLRNQIQMAVRDE